MPNWTNLLTDRSLESSIHRAWTTTAKSGQRTCATATVPLLYLHSTKGKTQNNSARSAETPTRKIGNSSHHICVVLREVRFAKDSKPPAAVSLFFCYSRDVFVWRGRHHTKTINSMSDKDLGLKAKTETFLEVWNAGRKYECSVHLYFGSRGGRKTQQIFSSIWMFALQEDHPDSP
jgi:hypothetical protein